MEKDSAAEKEITARLTSTPLLAEQDENSAFFFDNEVEFNRITQIIQGFKPSGGLETSQPLNDSDEFF
jgi:hypothetical protein